MYLGRAGQESTENVCLDRPVQNGLSCGLCGSVWLCPELSRTKCFADVRPEGHPDRHWSLYSLAWLLVEQYDKHGTLPDLEEAITLQRAALELRPEGHPN